MIVEFFKKKSNLLGIFISLVYFFILLFTLKDYGLNSDSPFHFMRGQTLLYKLTTGRDLFDQPSSLASPVLFYPGEIISTNKDGLNAYETEGALQKKIESFDGGPSVQEQFLTHQKQAGRQSFFKHNAWGSQYFIHDEAPGHPPISDILSAISNNIFYERLGVLGDIEAYHLYAAFTAVFVVFVVYLFVASVWGLPEALFASITLALYPFFFAESHFNIKDIPELAFFTASAISFYFWVVRGKKSWFVAFMLSFFLAFGTKFNVLFLPFILLPWLFLIRKTEVFKRWFTKRLFWYLAIFLVFESAFFILLWPWLWENTFYRILGLFGYYKEVGLFIKSGTSLFLLWKQIDPIGLILVLTNTPILGVVFTVVSLFSISRQFKSDKYNALPLVVFWFLITVGRVLLPGAKIFASLRQFAEVIVPLSILIGVGGVYLSRVIAKFLKVKNIYVAAIAFLAYFAYLAWITISYHPNQNAFFNLLIGEPKGAEERKLFLAWPWHGSFDNPYKQGIDWLNQNAEKGAKLAFLDGSMTAISPILLRQDIHIGSYFSGPDQKGEYIISIYNTNPSTDFPNWYLSKFINPVYEIKIKGAIIARVWKNDYQHLKEKYKNR